MSFNTKQPDAPAEPVAIQPEQLATNQQAIPVPWFWGTRKISARWITGVKNQIAVEVKNTTGKK